MQLLLTKPAAKNNSKFVNGQSAHIASFCSTEKQRDTNAEQVQDEGMEKRCTCTAGGERDRIKEKGHAHYLPNAKTQTLNS